MRAVGDAAMVRQALSDPDDEIYLALQERRAKLDRRVSDGEISPSTRTRYLRVYQRQLISSLGYGDSGWPERVAAVLLSPWLSRDR